MRTIMAEKEKELSAINESIDANYTIDENRCVFRDAINKYIDFLNSQMDSFPIIFNTLAANVKARASHYEKFINDKKVQIIEDEERKEVIYRVPLEYGKVFERIQEELSHSVNAYSFIPKNTVVAMVSLYDAYLANLIECAYRIKPELLNASEKEFSFSDIIAFESIDNLKKHVIEKDVESIIRESHDEQFKILSKRFGVPLTNGLPSFDDFIEITERRNLFVHTNGKVSSQYLKKCKTRPFDHKDEDVQIGEELFASFKYVEHCYEILFEIGVKLGQVIWRKLEKDLEKADDSLIDIGYQLIKKGRYTLACNIMDFACEPYVKHYNKACEYVLCVNHALAYYLKGDLTRCEEIINSNDWSGTDLKYRLAHKVLLEQYDEAIKIMKSIGKVEEMRVAYAEWPLFNNFGKNQQFRDTYKDIFGKDYQYTETQRTKWEDIVQEASNMIKESKEAKSKEHTQVKED